ncbi:2,6-dihydropseudooxynicotine hydrolase [Daldinia decipiens]|uniref:2,6-dihydropseudooxynicotine hydrolase n=1 Tax=Daldinia decipiens TaxID=326647 RepID=UPI0020C23B51|nr:2,6-dihydropseudooxynicotine hydrolase [Daldinia decipiens]KAI1659765.1 2,6-dihydropseudooxynicotine hydrolase [Daldinia decipiens]
MKSIGVPLFFLTYSSLVFGLPHVGKNVRMPQPVKRSNDSDPGSMLQLSSDGDFHFEILRALALAPYQGSDVGEVLVAADHIIAGDFESYYNAFYSLADRVHNQASAIDPSRYPVSARNAYFREATYYRSADFFLHGNWNDSRINMLWDKQLAAYDKAISLLPVPGERITLQGKGFQIPAIFFGSGQPGHRPTILMCTGYDGSQEELYHIIGEAALQRGINVITFEGPGQPTVRRQQNIGFIPEWEEVVSPVVDYAISRSDVDGKKLGLLGLSFGGYLAPRAAAFEHRLAAVIAFDGLYSFGQVIFDEFGPEMEALYRAGNSSAFDANIFALLAQPTGVPTSVRWGIEQGLWSFKETSPFAWATQVDKYRLDGVVQNITTPVFVADAQNDMFFKGQGKILADKLGDLATYHVFESIDGAGEHCSLGASVLSGQVILDWFQDLVSSS